MSRHGRSALLTHTCQRMGRRGAQDKAGRHHHRSDLHFLEPYRGTGRALPLGRTARPAPIPRSAPRRTDARGAAHRSVLSWRGAQRRHSRLGIPETMQAALHRPRLSRFYRETIPPDLFPDYRYAVEGRRTHHRLPVRQRIPWFRRLSHGTQAHSTQHRIRPAVLHPHRMARTLQTSTLRRDAATLWRLCRRILGQADHRGLRQLLQGIQLQGVPLVYCHRHRPAGGTARKRDQRRPGLPLLHLRTGWRHDDSLSPPPLHLS